MKKVEMAELRVVEAGATNGIFENFHFKIGGDGTSYYDHSITFTVPFIGQFTIGFSHNGQNEGIGAIGLTLKGWGITAVGEKATLGPLFAMWYNFNQPV